MTDNNISLIQSLKGIRKKKEYLKQSNEFRILPKKHRLISKFCLFLLSFKKKPSV